MCFQNIHCQDSVRIPFGTDSDTVKIHFTPDNLNCKMQITVSIVGCFQSACKYSKREIIWHNELIILAHMKYTV